MNPLESGLLWLHVASNLVWIGSIVAVGVALGATGDAKTRGEIGVAIYKRLAVPAFVLAFVAGLGRLLLDPSYYLKQHHWMHPKLLAALGVIALHHVIGARAKKLASGAAQEAKGVGGLAAGLLALAVFAAFFAIFKLPD